MGTWRSSRLGPMMRLTVTNCFSVTEGRLLAVIQTSKMMWTLPSRLHCSSVVRKDRHQNHKEWRMYASKDLEVVDIGTMDTASSAGLTWKANSWPGVAPHLCLW